MFKLFNFNKKNTIIGIIGIMISAGLTALLISLSVEEGSLLEVSTQAVIIRCSVTIPISACIGFLLFIMFGKKGFWLGFGGMMVMNILSIVLVLLGQVNKTLATVVEVLVFVALLLGGWLYNKRRNNKVDESLDDRTEEQKELDRLEEIKTYDKVGIGEKSIFLQSQSSRIFQVIKTDTHYVFHYVGNEFKGVLPENCVSKYQTINLKDYNSKKYFAISFEDIENIVVQYGAMIKHGLFGSVKFQLKNQKSKSYIFSNYFEQSELYDFFGDKIEIKNQDKSLVEQFKQEALEEAEKRNKNQSEPKE